jgi:hypothetical protein
MADPAQRDPGPDQQDRSPQYLRTHPLLNQTRVMTDGSMVPDMASVLAGTPDQPPASQPVPVSQPPPDPVQPPPYQQAGYSYGTTA